MKLVKHNEGLIEFPIIPKGITHISLFNNEIEEVPSSLWDEVQLESLNLSANKIESISGRIGNLIIFEDD